MFLPNAQIDITFEKKAEEKIQFNVETIIFDIERFNKIECILVYFGKIKINYEKFELMDRHLSCLGSFKICETCSKSIKITNLIAHRLILRQ